MSDKHRCGTVAIVGRPNVGKSTLLNRLVGMKISIVSRRAQTTRHRILGVVTDAEAQIIFVDTPGFQMQHGGPLNRIMNRAVTDVLSSVDAVMIVIEAGRITAQDRQVVGLLPKNVPVLLVINKIDRLKDKAALLPFIDQVRALHEFAEIVPVSAEKGIALDSLIAALKGHLPEAQALYDADTVTDRSERFLAAEIIREKLFHSLGDELPYSATVVIDRFEEEGALRRIHASIIVDKPGHKAIVIGKKGEALKLIATRARKEMEGLFGGKVFLEVWVRVKHGWADDIQTLHSLGYE